ncbi:MAG: hypothetical protein KGZ39_01760 [Simkania sp.]|nr:hypothetical protein [Simkania sp.]
MEHLWQVLSGAPWWVYVLFIYLVNIGIKSTQPRTISITRVALLPLVFVVWSVYTLYGKVILGFSSLILLWIVFLALGTYLGIKEVHSWHIHKDRHKQSITIPGNYSTLVLILLIFVLKFFWGYFYATHTNIPYWMYFLDTLTSSLATGFFVGRSCFFLKSYYRKH